MDVKRIFLSSTSEDFEEYRKAASEAIADLHYECVRMEDFSSNPQPPLQYLRELIPTCDLFVCVVGPFHGSTPEGCERSFTEEEYYAALGAGIPPLVFISDDKLPVPASHVESPESRHKQQAFRNLVRQRHLAQRFTSPPDLKARVMAAIHEQVLRGAQAGRPPLNEAPAQPAAGVKRNRGWIVHKMCDRGEEIARFNSFFKEHRSHNPGRPQFCLIAGTSGDRHDSLIDRFINEIVEPVCKDRDDEVVDVQRINTTWVHHDDLPRLQGLLVSLVSLELAPSSEKPYLTATDLSEGYASSKVVIVRHLIDAGKWDEQTGRLIDWYASFWGQLESRAPTPLFLIFLAVVYPDDEGRRKLWPFAGRSAADKARRELESVARRASRHCPCLLLSKLRQPTRGDLEDWFSRHWPPDKAAEGLDKSEEIFAACGGKISMREIERRLLEIKK